MVQNNERVVRGRITSKHIVQLFDTRETLAESVATFLLDGFRAHDTVLVVARQKHWRSISNHMERGGCPVSSAKRQGTVTYCDAARTMTRFMRLGQPVAELFQATVGNLVQKLTPADGRGLRIYGEMVDVLAEERNFPAARYLEELWNDLGLRQSFTLLCGYSSAHFADPSTAVMLADICDRHTHIHMNADDGLGQWVLKQRGERVVGGE